MQDTKLLVVSANEDQAQATQLISAILPGKLACGLHLSTVESQILPGDSRQDRAHQLLQAADGVVLLLSANFLRDDVMCMPLAEQAQRRWLQPSPPVLALLLDSCPWRTTQLRHLQPPTVGRKAWTQHSRSAAAWTELSEYVQDWISAQFPGTARLVGIDPEIESRYRLRAAEDLAHRADFVEPLVQLKWEPPPLLAAASGLHSIAQTTSPQTIARSPESIVKSAAVAAFLGGSGSGKTTLLNELGHRAAACGSLSLSAATPGEDWHSCASPMLPVFAKVAELAAPLKRHGNKASKAWRLLELLADHLRGNGSASTPAPARLLRRAWLAGRLLILLDDLEDAGDDPAQRLLERAIIDLVAQSPRGNRIVVTGNAELKLSAELAGLAETALIQGLSKTQIEKFLIQAAQTGTHWGRSPRDRLGTKGRQMLADIEQDADLRALVETPQMLKMWVVLRGSKIELASKGNDRVNLLTQYVDYQLDRYAEELRASPASSARARSRVERFLNHLALYFLESAAPFAVSMQQLRHELADVHDVELILPELSRLSDFLTENQDGRLAFRNTTIQSYFAARALAEIKSDERWLRMRVRLREPRWREPIVLCICLLKLTHRGESAGDRLLQQILDTAVASEEAASLELFMVLTCTVAAQRVGGSVPPILVTQLQKIARLQLPTVRLQAMHGICQLARLGVPSAQAVVDEWLAEPQPSAEFVRAAKSLVEAEPGGAVEKRLRELLLHPAPAIQSAAILALASAVRIDAQLRRQLVPFLDSLEEEVLRAACSVLMPLFATDVDIQTQLRSRIVVQKPQVVTAALTSIHDEQLADPEIRQIFDQQLREQSPTVRSVLLAQLIPRALSDQGDLAIFIAALDDPHLVVRNGALCALCYFSRWDVGIRDAVLAHISSDWPPLQPELPAQILIFYILFVRFLDLRDPLVWNRLRPKLKHPESVVREAMVNALTPWVEQIPELQDELWARVADDDESTEVRQLALGALLPVVALYPDKRPLLERRLRPVPAEGKWLNLPMVYALQELARIDVPTQKSLKSQLQKSANPYERCALLSLLLGSRPRDRAVFGELLSLLVHDDPGVAYAAFQALWPRLTWKSLSRSEVAHCLAHKHILVRRAAVQWLIRLPTTIASVRQSLIDQLADDDPFNFLFIFLDLLFGARNDPELLATCADALVRFNAKQCEAANRIPPVVLAAFLYFWKPKKVAAALARVRNQDAGLADDLSKSLSWLRSLLADPEGLLSQFTTALHSLTSLHPLLQLVSGFGYGKLAQSRAIDPMSTLGRHLDSPNQRLQLGALGAFMAAEPADLDATLVARASDAAADVNTRIASTAMLAVRGKSSEMVEQHYMMLQNGNEALRFVALEALLHMASTDRAIAEHLIPWIGVFTEGTQDLRAHVPSQQSIPWNGGALRMRIAAVVARYLPEDEKMYRQVVAMLASPTWQQRQGAAWALSLMPVGPAEELRERLRQLIGDRRGDETLPERLQVARALLTISPVPPVLLDEMVDLAKEGLRHGLEPWQLIPLQGPAVRQLALRLVAALPYQPQLWSLVRERATQDVAAAVREQAHQLLISMGLPIATPMGPPIAKNKGPGEDIEKP